MELFDKKFVYLEWDDVLQGKKVFVGDTLPELRRYVEGKNTTFKCGVEKDNSNSDYPFFSSDRYIYYAFAYYDPNYECKVAYAQGKAIQCRAHDYDYWEDCDIPSWLENSNYRVKPEGPVDLCRVFFDKKARCMVIGSKDYVNSNNYPVLFEGSILHCESYMREREKFNLVMAAYYCDGKKIQGRTKLLSDPWVDCTGEPRWSDACEYRVKPEDSKCNSCQYQCEPDMPCRTCRDGSNYKMRVVVKPEEKKWRPFKDIQELKQAWGNKQRRFQYPTLVEPLIWVRSKSNTKSTYLITHYCENMGVVYLCGYLNMGLEQLFEDYTFLDETPLGVEVEE